MNLPRFILNFLMFIFICVEPSNVPVDEESLESAL
ncbi:hypothetical protein A2U01_0113327 [Trifolium medium]|uniref:Uncharacterized protein n=1 Tax=Trifolium medium TaxID=97028 RepID=A0A392VYI4_9FABA|nr:hypothetical protein [Trifolium medium]